MPYTTEEAREIVLTTHLHEKAGDLAFELACVVDQYFLSHGINYQSISDVGYALEGVKHEMQRCIADPYEQKKREENGDVWQCLKSV